MLSKQKILHSLSENKDTLKKFGVKKIGLFGSYNRNQQNPNSDIDFLVEFYTDKKNFDNFMDLYFYLEEIFQCKIDLKTVKSLPENRDFTKNVLKEVEYAAI